MPWIADDLCVGCGVCVEDCPVGAIHTTDDRRAEIDEDECIRCGRCHESCPHDAVRHDGERIPQEIAANLQWVRELLEHYSDPTERAAFMERMGRFFNKERKVVQQTLDALASAGDDPARALDAAIRSLSGEGRDRAAAPREDAHGR